LFLAAILATASLTPVGSARAASAPRQPVPQAEAQQETENELIRQLESAKQELRQFYEQLTRPDLISNAVAKGALDGTPLERLRALLDSPFIRFYMRVASDKRFHEGVMGLVNHPRK